MAPGRGAEAIDAFDAAVARTPERVAALEGLASAVEVAADPTKATELRERLGKIQHQGEGEPSPSTLGG